MTLQTDLRVLKSMAEQYAIIDDKTGKDLCAVYARGDRRCRPMGWLPINDVDALYQNGHLKLIRKGYAFRKSTTLCAQTSWRLYS